MGTEEKRRENQCKKYRKNTKDRENQWKKYGKNTKDWEKINGRNMERIQKTLLICKFVFLLKLTKLLRGQIETFLKVSHLLESKKCASWIFFVSLPTWKNDFHSSSDLDVIIFCYDVWLSLQCNCYIENNLSIFSSPYIVIKIVSSTIAAMKLQSW